MALTAFIFGKACAIARTRFADSLRPAGGMSEFGTGTGFSETVVWVVVAGAVVVAFSAPVAANGEVFSGDRRELVLAADGDARARASSAAARRPDVRTRRG